jgi:EAL domain-containing protein (putative c-di-GMP-specific phosphodiesterase class I)
VQLADLSAIHEIERILRRSWPVGRGFRLSFEITEGTMMHNSDAVSKLLTRLGDLHIGLDIDDFGTGYSSLSQLQHLPVQTLKIDRAFVGRIGLDGGDSLEITRTIVALAHNLGMDVIAEGVETAQQLAQLKALDCEYAQGYYFGKPTDQETAWSLIPAPGADLPTSPVALAPPPAGNSRIPLG